MAPVRSRPDPRASRLVLTLLLIPAFVGLSAGRAAAVTCSVKNLNTSTFSTDLQGAIAAAAPGAALRISGTCVGNFTVAQDLRLFGVYGATLDGNSTGSTLTISAGDVKVSGLRITNGTGTDVCSPDGCIVGGGIDNHGALTLVRSSVDGNSASNLGGGIFNDVGATSTIVGSRVSGNTGSFAGGGIRNLGTVVLWRSTVDGNTAQAGGAIINNGSVTITRSMVRDNVATDLFGGAIINNGTLTINRSTLSGNSAPAAGGYGGAITNQIGTVSITDSVVSGNSATALGGGIMGQTDGAVILTRSSISENSAPFGGGIFESGGSLTITSSRIAGNSAGNGGGVYASSTATVVVNRSAIQGNTATNAGGGFFLAGTGITIDGSQVRGNSAGTGGGIYGSLGSVLHVSRSRVSSNAALVGIGGGVFTNGTVALTRSSMTENTANSAGGAMFSLGGTVTVTDSTIGGNTASSGGGLLNTGGTMNVVRSTVKENSVSFNGGGIFNSDGQLTIRSSTLSANSASDPNGGGGGLYNGIDIASTSTVDIASSTMSGNYRRRLRWGHHQRGDRHHVEQHAQWELGLERRRHLQRRLRRDRAVRPVSPRRSSLRTRAATAPASARPCRTATTWSARIVRSPQQATRPWPTPRARSGSARSRTTADQRERWPCSRPARR